MLIKVGMVGYIQNHRCFIQLTDQPGMDLGVRANGGKPKKGLKDVF